MLGRERVQKVLQGEFPDKVPHFELVFQLEEEAFGKVWPSAEAYGKADTAGRTALVDTYFDIWEQIVERYHWDALPIPYSLGPHLAGEFIPMARERFGDRVALFDFNGEGTFWMLPGDQMMEFAVRLYEDWEGLLREAEEKCQASIALAEKQIQCGVDFICINSDYGYNQGPFISPAMFSELITPFLARIVDAIHAMGSKAILHSDGNLRMILDQLVSTGLDGYQSIDPQGSMDIAEVRRQYPDLILMGNVQSSLLQEVDEQAIRGCVRYAMDSAKDGGRYIFSTSNCIFKGMPLESYHIMLDEYNKLCSYT